MVGGLGGAGVGAGENLGMRHDEPLSSGHGVAGQGQPDGEVAGVERRFERAGFSVHVVRVHAVDEQCRIHAGVGFRSFEDLAHGAATCAPAAQHHAVELDAGLGFSLRQQTEKAPRVVKQARIDGGTLAGLNTHHGHFVPRGGHFRQPGSAVKEEEDGAAAMGRQEERAEVQLLTAAGSGLFLQALVCARVLHHGRRVLRLLRASGAQHHYAGQQQSHGMPLRGLLPWRAGGRFQGETAVVPAVTEVHDEANHQPHDQPQPVNPPQLVHHVSVEANAQNWHQRHPWGPKWPRMSGVCLP